MSGAPFDPAIPDDEPVSPADSDRAAAESVAAGSADDAVSFGRHVSGELDTVGFHQLLLDSETLQGFLAEVVGRAAAVLGRHCSITVRGQAGPYTVAHSDELSERLDELQYRDGQGPCLQALADGVAVLVTDMATETRWDGYPAHAHAAGAGSSLSVPLLHQQRSLGASNLYADYPTVPGQDLHEQAAGMAGHAAGALALALRIAERDELIGHLQTALSSRSVIDQAIGILMAQQRCDAETAFGILRAASQGRNVKLRDLAGGVVSSVAERGDRDGQH